MEKAKKTSDKLIIFTKSDIVSKEIVTIDLENSIANVSKTMVGTTSEKTINLKFSDCKVFVSLLIAGLKVLDWTSDDEPISFDGSFWSIEFIDKDKNFKYEGSSFSDSHFDKLDKLITSLITLRKIDEDREPVLFFHEHEENGLFSNWYMSDFVIDNVKYCCVEQYIMASKAKMFSSFAEYEQIMESRNPDEMKKLGRRVKGFDDEIWDKNKEEILYKGLKAKFLQNEMLFNALMDTKDAFIGEASPYDSIYGLGANVNKIKKIGLKNCTGENLLGKSLMKLRKELAESLEIE